MYKSWLTVILQYVQVAFMAKEWADHTLGQAREAEGKLEIVEGAHAEVDKKLKETLSQLAGVEKFWKNTEAALASYKKQAAESLEAQKRAENSLALTMVKVKKTAKTTGGKGCRKVGLWHRHD